LGHDLVFGVGAEEAAGVLTLYAEESLGVFIRAEAEELGGLRDLIGGE